MKRRSVFLAECTYKEVEDQLEKSGRIFVPLGSTEQHGPQGPQGTDTILATEVSARLARRVGGMVAPAVPYGYSIDHRGFKGLAWLSASTLSAVLGDICVSLAEGGFREIIVVNGHYTNVVAMAAGVAAVADRLGPGARAWAFSYWDALPPDQLQEFLSLETGLHAQVGETSAVLAVDESLVDMEAAVTEWPAFPAPQLSTLLPFFLSSPGTVYRATRSGVWGDARAASVEKGRLFLDQVEVACIQLIASVEATFEAFPRQPSERS